MATEILAAGTTDANSGDVTVVAGTPLTVALKDAAGKFVAPGAHVEIQLKDDAGQYFWIDELTSGDPAKVIIGPGTYRFVRRAGTSCGVFSG